MPKKSLLLSILLALSPLAYWPFAQWEAMSYHGTGLFLWIGLFSVLLLLCAAIAVPICLIPIVISRRPFKYVLALLFLLVFIASFTLGLRIGEKIRMECAESFATRSQFLIEAIEEFEKDHRQPPQALADLVPDYLTAVPSTGMGAYPEYEYCTGGESRKEYQGNPWALSVFTPSGGINFDMMLYLPRQNYPEHGYGGTLQRIGDWAYVHE